jgi:hypothetical protein
VAADRLLLGGAADNLIDRSARLGDGLHQAPALAGLQRRRHRRHVSASLCSNK